MVLCKSSWEAVMLVMNDKLAEFTRSSYKRKKDNLEN